MGELQDKTGALRALQIVRYSDTTGLELVPEEVERLRVLLEEKQHASKQLAVLSVAGAYRRGKSFFLNFVIKYLVARAAGVGDWLGDSSGTLQGFKWANGSARKTVGIWVWPQLFSINDQMSLLLVDTQGVYDTASTEKESAVVFALSALLSSVQVYNIHERIISTDLDHLQVYLEVGKCAVQSSEQPGPPTQQICFLIRDWKFPEEFSYGIDGGQQLLSAALEGTEETKKAGSMLKNCFISPVLCFLLPHPGEAVSSQSTFVGTLSEIRPEFIAYLRVLLDRLLSPSYLVAKRLGGAAMTAAEFVPFLRATTQSLKSGTGQLQLRLFEILKSNAEAEAVEWGKRLYRAAMKESFKGTKRTLQTEQFVATSHAAALEEVWSQLAERRIFGEHEGDGREAVKNTLIKECELLQQPFLNVARAIQERREQQKRCVEKSGLLLGAVVLISGLAAVSSGGLLPMMLGGVAALLGGTVGLPLAAGVACGPGRLSKFTDPPCYKIADLVTELPCAGGKKKVGCDS